jgi:pimeloyl-ACP methyl ester carboxylesterase
MTTAAIGEHTPVLALHCSLGSSAQWRSLARGMPEREVIALDLLGYGDAPHPTKADDFSLDDEVDAVEHALLRHIDAVTPLHVVGHSYGGAVAWLFALRHPTRVKSIALFEPMTIWLVRDHPEAEPFHALARRCTSEVDTGMTMQAAQRFVNFWSGPGAFSALPLEKQAAFAQHMCKVKLDFHACRSERSAVPKLGYLQMPALLMNGRHGLQVMRKNLSILQLAFDDCMLAELPGGHMAPVENRLQIDSVISTFIRKSERQSDSSGVRSILYTSTEVFES